MRMRMTKSDETICLLDVVEEIIRDVASDQKKEENEEDASSAQAAFCLFYASLSWLSM